MSRMRVIKQTTSVSPLTSRTIDAAIVEDEGRVFLTKRDEQGKEHKCLIEEDLGRYQELTRREVASQVQPFQIFLYVSGKCNLNCPVCYEYRYRDQARELSLEEIARITAQHKGKYIVLCGREPTLREDLPEIIKTASSRNTVLLLTNGLKLVDYKYLLKLKRSGLRKVIFAFDGLTDQVYQEMNGAALLELKLKALANIKRAGMEVGLSVTVARGINDNQIKAIYDFCLKNKSYIFELRIRSISSVGKYLDVQPYCISELLKLVASSIGVDPKQAFEQNAQINALIPKRFKQSAFAEFARPKVCSFTFYVRKDGRGIARLGKATFLSYALSYLGVKCKMPGLIRFLGIASPTRNKKILRIGLKSWPNIYNIDLGENKKCPSLYYDSQGQAPFCYYNIIKNSKQGKV